LNSLFIPIPQNQKTTPFLFSGCRKKDAASSHTFFLCLLSDVAPDDLADVPEVRSLPGRIEAILLFVILKMRSLGAAVHAHDIPAPAVLLLQQAGAAAKGAVLQGEHFMDIHLVFSHRRGRGAPED
jgi:hypothetical protein